MESHENFMRKALLQAKKSLKEDETPIGAVIVSKSGQIIAQARNQVEKKNMQSCHAEILAINKATKKINNWRLEGCTIYVTLEPCLMCFGLIRLSRIENLVFGAKSTLFGFSNFIQPQIFCPNLEITSRVCQKESLNLLKIFFANARGKRICNGEKSS